MELKEGMYVRTKAGTIDKITKDEYGVCSCPSSNNIYCEHHILATFIIAKASYNIIDLIKSKDIILGKDGKLYQCWKVYKDYVFTYSKNKQGQTITLVDYQIDKVMCYEQFESMSYKVGE